MSPIPRPTIVTAALLATLLACDEPAPEPAGEEAPPIPADTAPVDSVAAWAADIRAGIAPLPERVETDPEATRQRAVELYITRQERIERAVGPGTGSAPELAEAVHEAEARFHALMQLLGETPPPARDRVAQAVGALDAQIGAVIELLGPADVAADGTSR